MRGGYTDSSQEKKVKRTQRGVDSLSKRPAVFQAGSPIAIGVYTRTATLTAAAGDLINWSSLDETMALSDDYFGLTAGSDVQIKLPGVYAFDLRVTSIGTAFTSGKLVTYLLNVDVDSGSVGFWSTATASGSDEGLSQAVVQQQDAVVADAYTEPPPLTGHAVWLPTDTLPVVISAFVQFAEDAVGRQISTAFRWTWLRLGDADV